MTSNTKHQQEFRSQSGHNTGLQRNRRFSNLASEADIQAAICDLLALLKIPFTVSDAALVVDRRGKVYGRKVSTLGWCDVTACLPSGRLLAIEVKARRGRLRESQKAMLEQLRKCNALIIVPRSIEEFAESLIEAGVQNPLLNQLLNR